MSSGNEPASIHTVQTGERPRLDAYLAKVFTQFSRSVLERLIEAGGVTVNGKQERPSERVKQGDTLKIDWQQLLHTPDALDIPILYEDDDVLVIDKPAGVLSHSKGAYNPEATVASWLAHYLGRAQAPGDDGTNRDGIVHRLDRATSGVMVVAKNREAELWLKKQFSQRRVKKMYHAVVEGVPKLNEAILEWPLARNPDKPQTFHVSSGGRAAVTHYKLEAVSEKTPKVSLLELKPTTGRTHQLRVHMKQLGHAILGDSVYGKQKHRELRMYLHASELELTLPSRERKRFNSVLPDVFKQRLHSEKTSVDVQ